MVLRRPVRRRAVEDNDQTVQLIIEPRSAGGLLPALAAAAIIIGAGVGGALLMWPPNAAARRDAELASVPPADGRPEQRRGRAGHAAPAGGSRRGHRARAGRPVGAAALRRVDRDRRRRRPLRRGPDPGRLPRRCTRGSRRPRCCAATTTAASPGRATGSWCWPGRSTTRPRRTPGATGRASTPTPASPSASPAPAARRATPSPAAEPSTRCAPRVRDAHVRTCASRTHRCASRELSTGSAWGVHRCGGGGRRRWVGGGRVVGWTCRRCSTARSCMPPVTPTASCGSCCAAVS